MIKYILGLLFLTQISYSAQINNSKFIGNNVVKSSNIRLDNNTFLRSRNAANDADINFIGVNSSDNIVLTANGTNYNAARAVSPFYPKDSDVYDLGDVNLKWKDAWALNFKTNVITMGSQTIPSGATMVGAMGTNFLVDAALFTGNNSNNDTAATRTLYLETGNKTVGTGASGDILITTGTATGTRGQIVATSRLLNVASAITTVKVTADPCADTSAYPEGAIFYNNTSDYYCFCTGAGADVQMHNPAVACF